MAVVTFLGGRDVKFGFTYCNNAIMAFAATANRFLVIKQGQRRKIEGGMTGFTRVGGSHMVW